METTDFRRALENALLEAAVRASTSDFAKLAACVRRALRNGDFPPGVAVADVLDLQLAVIRRGRCPVPYCSYRTSLGKASRPRRGAPPSPAPGNEHRLCREHRRLWREGDLRVSGPPDSPSFFTSDGKPITFRSG